MQNYPVNVSDAAAPLSPGTISVPTSAEPPFERTTMNGKPVYTVPGKTVISLNSAFVHKLLCTGLTFSAGDRCAYTCAFCYVDGSPTAAQVRAILADAKLLGLTGQDIVIRRAKAAEVAHRNLRDQHGNLLPCTREPDTIFASPLVDVAANMDLVRETVEIMMIIFRDTCWDIRLLSKSTLLPRIADLVPAQYAHRVIYGVSSGTLDTGLARAIEAGTPPPARRLASLRELQDRGLRTYGMICPSLPQDNPLEFSERLAAELRPERLEHVWAEVINVRGKAMTNTVGALLRAGYEREAGMLAEVSGPGARARWNAYSRRTFEAHRAVFGDKLRYLQYVKSAEEIAQWSPDIGNGAVLLGRAVGH